MTYLDYINKQIIEAIERKDVRTLDRLEEKVYFYIEKGIDHEH